MPRAGDNLGLPIQRARSNVWKTLLRAIVVVGASVVLLVLDAQQPAGQPGKAAPKGDVQGLLTWFDRQGKVVGTAGEPGLYRTLTISPDGKRIAVERADSQTQNRDIWVLEVASGKAARFTSDPAWEAFPTWSPDASRIIFTSNRGGVYDLYQKALNDTGNGTGTEELLYKSSEGKGPTSWSPDGRFLLYYSLGQPTHVKLLAASGPADRAPVPVVDPQFNSITARFSPDGRWIIYSSNESGANEVSVRPFDPATGAPGKPIVVTSGGGRTPLWRGDGKEIFYIGSDGMVTAMEVSTLSGLKSGTPKPLFKVPEGVTFWDVAPDGTRFLMPAPAP
jgi:Tol biopolymer transport system component